MQSTMILPSPSPVVGGFGGYRTAGRPNRLRTMLRAATARAAPLEMDPRMLAETGVTHAAALREAARTRRRVSLVAALRRMAEAIRTRRQLAAMDERMLSDLAISRADALREAARGPWDATPAAWHPR
jgi:uncharacterized protein YjiS (DUF1127 family)